MAFEPKITKVHADARGEIYSISLPDNRELMLLHSVQGSLRGGHSHSVPEAVMVLLGKMRYWKRGPHGNHGERVFTLKAGECSPTAAHTDHYAEFLEDTWLIEVKHARIGEWTQAEYKPWRKLVLDG